MKAILSNDTIQVELTNSCPNRCSNCTRFVGHVNPFFMSFDTFKEAIDSMVGFPKMVGFTGGEALIHPEFEKFCSYALSKIPREQLGLWTCFPKGYEKYRETICKTFGNIFLNDHTRPDVMHHPFLVGIEEVIKDQNKMFNAIDHCWAQQDWSASINPNGAFFCEMAASMSMLFPHSLKGWPVKKGWWWKTAKDYTEQIEHYCPRCGGAAALKRRASIEMVDDISPKNLERLKKLSPKLKAGDYVIHDLKPVQECDMGVMQAYKDQTYRDVIAARYGIFLTLNQGGFNEPHLMRKGTSISIQSSIMDQLKEKYAA